MATRRKAQCGVTVSFCDCFLMIIYCKRSRCFKVRRTISVVMRLSSRSNCFKFHEALKVQGELISMMPNRRSSSFICHYFYTKWNYFVMSRLLLAVYSLSLLKFLIFSLLPRLLFRLLLSLYHYLIYHYYFIYYYLYC